MHFSSHIRNDPVSVGSFLGFFPKLPTFLFYIDVLYYLHRDYK